MTKDGPGARQLAELFHERYERLAPQFGYTTRPESRTFDPTSTNGKLMIDTHTPHWMTKTTEGGCL